MADIFGNDPGDYQYLVDTVKDASRMGVVGDSNDVLEAYLRKQAKQATNQKRKAHNFDALGSLNKPGIAGVGDFESNAQVLGYVENNLEAARTVAEEVLYTEMRLEEYVAMAEGVPEGAKTYAYDIVDYAGRGKFLDNDGSQAPNASVSLRRVPYNLYEGGIDADFTRADIREAAFAGVPLQAEVVKAAVRGAMNHIQDVAFMGDAPHSFEGMFNHSAITKDTSIGTFSTKNADAMIKSLQEMIRRVVVDTKEVFGRTIRSGFCIYMPHEQADLITNTPRSIHSDTTVWDFVKEHNTWYEFTQETIDLKWVLELEDIVTGSPKHDRIVVGIMDNRVGEVAIPIRPRPIAPQMMGRKILIPFEYKMSGFNLKRGEVFRYYDQV